MKAERVHVAVCLAAIAFAVAFAVPSLIRVPVLWYYPLERHFAFESQPHALAMDFYGRVLGGLAAAMVGFGLGWLASRWSRARQPAVLGLFTAWMVTAILGVAAMHVSQLVGRKLTPMALPADADPGGP